jgi:hypothetical protein
VSRSASEAKPGQQNGAALPVPGILLCSIAALGLFKFDVHGKHGIRGS